MPQKVQGETLGGINNFGNKHATYRQLQMLSHDAAPPDPAPPDSCGLVEAQDRLKYFLFGCSLVQEVSEARWHQPAVWPRKEDVRPLGQFSFLLCPLTMSVIVCVYFRGQETPPVLGSSERQTSDMCLKTHIGRYEFRYVLKEKSLAINTTRTAVFVVGKLFNLFLFL